LRQRRIDKFPAIPIFLLLHSKSDSSFTIQDSLKSTITMAKKRAVKKSVSVNKKPSAKKTVAKKAAKKVAKKAAKGVKKTAPKSSLPKSAAAADSSPATKKTAGSQKRPLKKAVAKKAVAKKGSVKKTIAKKGTGKNKAASPTKKKAGSAVKRKAAPAGNGGKAAKSKGRGRKLKADLIGQWKGKREEKGASSDPRSSSRSGPGVFTIEDVREILAQAQKEDSGNEKATVKKATKKGSSAQKKTEAKVPAKVDELPSRPPQTFGAVSMADILGFNPLADDREHQKNDETAIPKKFLPYYRQLMQMRAQVSDQIDRHSEESRILSKSRDSDSGNYRESSNDADSETFDIDFALSLVSSEQEAIYEINEAIDRMKAGTYGTCEITGKPIGKQRLKAVPFTRYSLEGQKEVEGSRRRSVSRSVGVFSTSTEDVAAFGDSDDE